jgi:uncharacterized protein (DUF302 family)
MMTIDGQGPKGSDMMNTTDNKGHRANGRRVWPLVGAGVAGVIVGVVLTALVAWQMMPGMMIIEYESRYGLDETVAKLKSAAEANGWTVPAVRNMNASLAKQGVDFPRQVRLVEVCKAEYAESVLASDRHVATLMPCAFAVFEADDGSVHISAMNTGLMGTMFGGNIAEVMGGKVGPDEHKMLAEVIKQ